MEANTENRMGQQLNVFFLPMLAAGHMIPIFNMAKLFASRGVKATIVTTPLNALGFSKSVEKSRRLGLELSIKIIEFPAIPGLPQGCENANQLTSHEMFRTFFSSTISLREQVEQLLQEYRPHCLVADMFFPWATDSAAKFHIPRLVFHGTSFFAVCAAEQLRLHKTFENVLSDSELFLVPNLPHEVKISLSQICLLERETCFPDFFKTLVQARESETRSYGVVVNSFFGLEPDYADHYRDVLKRKAWHVGPVSLCCRRIEDEEEHHECLKWLDSKKSNSVVYVCFGSLCVLPGAQLWELAMGLENSGQDFIWVTREENHNELGENEKWLPRGFEERIEGKGLIIRGWVPQELILGHEAVGGFVTHCGWNSSLEAISAGVPMVTWPTNGDQFYNEKLLTDILRIGVAVGAKVWVGEEGGAGVKREAIEMAVKRLMMGDEEGEGRRNRAKAFKEMAREAVEEGGSSYLNFDALLRELSLYRT